MPPLLGEKSPDLLFPGQQRWLHFERYARKTHHLFHKWEKQEYRVRRKRGRKSSRTRLALTLQASRPEFRSATPMDIPAGRVHRKNNTQREK